MRPQYEVPLTCWKRGDVGKDGGPALMGLGRAALKGEELGEWKDLCPMHAAAVSYVLMADQGDTFKRWYKEAGQDLGNGTVLATVDAEGRLLEEYVLEPKP